MFHVLPASQRTRAFDSTASGMARIPWHRRAGLQWKVRRAWGVVVQVDVYQWQEVPRAGYSTAVRIATGTTLREALAKAKRKLKIES
jgi:hypothetical protein